MTSQAIPWENLEQIISIYEENVPNLVTAKKVVPLNYCEEQIPDLFSKLHDIIRPALIQCGKIKGVINDDTMHLIIMNVIKMQKCIQNQMNRDQCLQECIATIKSDKSNSMRSEFDEVIPVLTYVLEGTFESINGQFQDLKNEMLNGIKDQFASILYEHLNMNEPQEKVEEHKANDSFLNDIKSLITDLKKDISGLQRDKEAKEAKIEKLQLKVSNLRSQDQTATIKKLVTQLEDANIKYFTAMEEQKVDKSSFKSDSESQIKKLKLNIESLSAANQELLNKVELSNQGNKSSISSCYKFYENLDTLQINDYQFKRDFKWKIIHPYVQFIPKKPSEEIPQYEVMLKMCTIYKGVPHGPAHINFTHPTDQGESFEGVGMFNNGQLHGGPFLCIKGDDGPRSYELMTNGRPAEGSNATYFSKQGNNQHVSSLTEVTDASGWQFYSGQLKDSLRHGQGKGWLTDARTFTGVFKRDKMKQGTLNELQKNGTVNISKVSYNAHQDYSQDITPSNQIPSTKDIVSRGTQFQKLHDFQKEMSTSRFANINSIFKFIFK